MAAMLSIVGALLVLAGPASASRIRVVRDVSVRDAKPLPVKQIAVVRDVSVRDAKPLPVKQIAVVRDVGARAHVTIRPEKSIQVVRDTPARDAARAARRMAKAIAYFQLHGN